MIESMSFKDEDWMEKAVCRDSGPEVFFHPNGERGRSRTRREEAAKQLCRVCPALKECREYALANNEQYGTWGGLSEIELRSIYRGNAV